MQTGFLAGLLNRGEIPAVRAVDGVDFEIRRGEVFGLAGESGSGKSTVGRLVLNLLQPTTGQVLFDGVDLSTLGHEEMRRLRSRMQIIFQDPLASLNPRMTIGQAIAHPSEIHQPDLAPSERHRAVLEMLEAVGMAPPEIFVDKYPHQISGGQRQRVVIARALITQPELIVADEPIAMADVSVRALLLDLMMKLKDEFDLTYLFITHDLATAKYVCDRIAIMYLGRIAEIGPLGRRLPVGPPPLHRGPTRGGPRSRSPAPPHPADADRRDTQRHQPSPGLLLPPPLPAGGGRRVRRGATPPGARPRRGRPSTPGRLPRANREAGGFLTSGLSPSRG